jgi:hypothetical protein
MECVWEGMVQADNRGAFQPHQEVVSETCHTDSSKCDVHRAHKRKYRHVVHEQIICDTYSNEFIYHMQQLVQATGSSRMVLRQAMPS